MVFLKVSLLGYNKLIVLDIDAGVAAWTGGGGGGGGGDTDSIVTVKDIYMPQTGTNGYWGTLKYTLNMGLTTTSPITVYANTITYIVSKVTINNDEFLRFSALWGGYGSTTYTYSGSKALSTSFSSSTNTYADRYKFDNKNQDAILTLIQAKTKKTAENPKIVSDYYFNTKYLDFTKIFTSLEFSTPTNTVYPIVVDSLVQSSNPESDSTGTSLTLNYYSGGSIPSNTEFFIARRSQMWTDLSTSGATRSGYGINNSFEVPNYYIGVKSSNDIVCWLKGPNIIWNGSFFDFSTVFTQ